MIDLSTRFRRLAMWAIHFTIMVMALLLAFTLRFDGALPRDRIAMLARALPWAIIGQTVGLMATRAHKNIWRYTGLNDLLNIIAGACLGTLIFFVVTMSVFEVEGFPRSIYIIDCILLICGEGGARMLRRLLHERMLRRGRTRILIFGAGKAGEMIVRDMKNNPFYDCDPIGFIDDDSTKIRQRIHNVPVLGNRGDLPRIIRDHMPDEVVVALSKAPPSVIRRVVSSLEPYKIPIKIVPSLRDVLSGKLEISKIRRLSIEDLLERAPLGLDRAPLRKFLHGRSVMITGAGGSIGSELCRQVMEFGPRKLVLFERHENNLYTIENDLREPQSSVAIIPQVADLTDTGRIREIMDRYRPDVVFHTAAYKHVPLMEQNVCEAVKNNVRGTRILAEAARDAGVARMILISTDKAVNPTSVMGATKRIAELMLQSMRQTGGTHLVTVRFGNVLGSSGSVVPRFLQQIQGGGPVTVTHPEMRRFFMSIPEAVQLVLHAAVRGEAGKIYVLEMGEQISIVEMARNLIRLAGYIPDEEIPISFIGLRPGEKLFEELVGEDETLEPSSMEQILRVRVKTPPEAATILSQVLALEEAAQEGRRELVLSILGEMLPVFAQRTENSIHPDAAMTLGSNTRENGIARSKDVDPAV